MTVLTEAEIDYRKQLITIQVICPITKDVLSYSDGEVIYSEGVDYFICTKGLKILKDIFGDKFIDERVITYD